MAFCPDLMALKSWPGKQAKLKNTAMQRHPDTVKHFRNMSKQIHVWTPMYFLHLKKTFVWQLPSQHRSHKGKKSYVLCLQKLKESKSVLLSTCLWDITWDNTSFFHAFVILYEHQPSWLDFINHQLTVFFQPSSCTSKNVLERFPGYSNFLV